MSRCTVHPDFFDDTCAECKKEYADLKGLNDNFQQTTNVRRKSSIVKLSNYKEFTEERAKKLYEELILQYINKGLDGPKAAERARIIIRRQCMLRGIEVWPWVE